MFNGILKSALAASTGKFDAVAKCPSFKGMVIIHGEDDDGCIKTARKGLPRKQKVTERRMHPYTDRDSRVFFLFSTKTESTGEKASLLTS
mmetsp:Transcript_69485/g.104856  ORF Transcript_69485/g.104856 Transcript_69485/m.104856 type:complete len:90 (-) Transcript_69485:61-330(-)